MPRIEPSNLSSDISRSRLRSAASGGASQKAALMARVVRSHPRRSDAWYWPRWGEVIPPRRRGGYGFAMELDS